MNSEMLKFCQENNCTQEAKNIITQVYDELDKEDREKDEVIVHSIDHIVEKADFLVCDTCYEHHNGCRNKENILPCPCELGEDVLKKACLDLEESYSPSGFYRYVCKDIVLYFRTPFVRDYEY